MICAESCYKLWESMRVAEGYDTTMTSSQVPADGVAPYGSSRVPLFDACAFADGHHDVRAPGGYEWWYFDAEDPASDTQIVVIMMQAFIFHPGYLRAYARYMKHPTRHAPPLPADHPSLYACVYRAGRIWRQFYTDYAPGDFASRSDRAEVSIGPHRLTTEPDGAYALDVAGTPWRLTARGPRRFDDETLGVRLRFSPRHRINPVERRFLSEQMTGAEHHWVIAAPVCDVRGELEVAGERVLFSGRGYHDHNFGLAPIGSGLYRWTWGRAIFGSRVLTFHYAEPKARGAEAETHLIEVDEKGAREIEVGEVRAQFDRTSAMAMQLKYPSEVDFGSKLRLSNPRVLDPAPFYMRIAFDAESDGERSMAFAELAYPHRLRWPLLGRMIQMSFDDRPRRAGRR